MKYRIKWTAIRTGMTGQGTGEYSKADADKIVAYLNKKNASILRHEAVPADDENDEREQADSDKEGR